MFSNSKTIFTLFKWHLKLNYKLIIFLIISFSLLFALLLYFWTLFSDAHDVFFKDPNLDNEDGTKKYHYLINGFSKSSFVIFGQLSYYFYALFGFIIISISSICFTSKLFLKELEGKIIIWLMSGVSKKQLIIMKFLTIQFINILIIFVPVTISVTICLLSEHDDEIYKRFLIMIANFILYVIAIASIYFSLSMIFIKNTTLFLLVSFIFYFLTIVFTITYFIAYIKVYSPQNAGGDSGPFWSGLLKLKYVTYPYLFTNLFPVDIELQTPQNLASEIFKHRHQTKLNLKPFDYSKVLKKDMILFSITATPYLLIYLIAEKNDYQI
ncbi:hypothetical protein [Spiroplasma endosymbiont of Crioceris asparagi]|uniref:hypothetical protein n=1 Tax=Spiroplasma endosymbiont of Crioceris asparagi TaxID=3066286 RepID=UPI0030D11307